MMSNSYDTNSENHFIEEMYCLTLQEVIQHAVTACRIPWAQAFLRRQASPTLCLEDLKRSGLLHVYGCLQRQDLDQATSLLRNMVSQGETAGALLCVSRHAVNDLPNLSHTLCVATGLLCEGAAL